MFGEMIADYWQSYDVEWEGWAAFLNDTIVILIISVLISYGLYLFLFPRIWRIRKPSDVFKLREPFKLTLILVFVGQLVSVTVYGLAKFQGVAMGDCFYWAFITGLLGILAIWILTLIKSPSKIKFAPWGRRRILHIFGRI